MGLQYFTSAQLAFISIFFLIQISVVFTQKTYTTKSCNLKWQIGAGVFCINYLLFFFTILIELHVTYLAK